jgi:hypothetical protein
MFQEYDVVRLKKLKASLDVSVNDKGTILMVFDEPNLPRAYEVEFVDKEGRTIALATVFDDEIEPFL